MHVDALHADAALAGLVEGSEYQAVDDEVEAIFLVLVDDAGGVATQFQNHFLAPGSGLEIPADLTAGERQQLESLVLDKRRGAVAGDGQDGECSPGQVGFGQYLADDQRTDRGLFRRFQYERAAGGDGRSDLVRHQVEGKVEWRDQRAGADRHALGEAAVAVGAFGDFQIDDFAADLRGQLGRDAEGVDQAGDFPLCIMDRLAGFHAQGPGQFVADVHSCA